MWLFSPSRLSWGSKLGRLVFDHLAARLQTVQELIKVSDQQRTKTMTYLREIATRWDPPSGIEPCSADCHHCVSQYAAAADDAQGVCCTSCRDQYSWWQPPGCAQRRSSSFGLGELLCWVRLLRRACLLTT